MTIVERLAKTAWEDCKPYIKYAYSFNRNTPSDTSLSGKIKGVYIFTERGIIPDVGQVIYVGETFSKMKYNGINGRIRRHKSSLQDPSWVGEHTGRKFLQYNIPLDIYPDLWYIDSSDVGINDKQSSASIEQLIQKHLKPSVWDIK